MAVDTTVTAAMLDDNKTTIKKYNWPTTRKWDYVAPLLANGDKDGCYQDIVYLRLADTYLLYAEALLKNNQAGEAIKWINYSFTVASKTELHMQLQTADA